MTPSILNNFDKRIVTHKWGNNPTRDEYTSSNGYIIAANHYCRTMEFFKVAAKEAKKDFPELKDSDIEVFVITDSCYNKGFSGIKFSLPDNAKKNGYRYSSTIDFSYL
jgi:hypothetical protein